MSRNAPKTISPLRSLPRVVKDTAATGEKVNVQMLRLDNPQEVNRIISNDSVDYEEDNINSVHSYSDSCRNSSSSCGRGESTDNLEVVDRIPSYEKKVTSRQRSSTVAYNNGEVGINMNRPLRNRVSSAGRADRSSGEAFRMKKSPPSTSAKETDSNSGVEENLTDRPRKGGPVFKYGNRSLKDESWRKDHRSTEHKPKLTDSVTKRQKHTSVSKNGNSRPISMSLAKRKSVVSNRFDTDTLALLGSLNLINLNDPEKTEYEEDDIPAKSYFSPNGASNIDDLVSNNENNDNDYDYDVNGSNNNRMSYLNMNSCEYYDKAHSSDELNEINRNGIISNSAEKGIHSNFSTMDVIYEENAPFMDHIREKSPYYFSTNNSPVNPKIKLIELKPKKNMKTSTQKLSPPNDLSPARTLSRDICGLLDGDGILEFCTVDADLFSLLKNKEIIEIIENTDKISKKSIYDIDDSDNCEIDDKKEKLLASYSSFITPKKSHSLPCFNFSIEHIHDFCFPSGIRIDYFDPIYADLITSSSGKISYFIFF